MSCRGLGCHPPQSSCGQYLRVVRLGASREVKYCPRIPNLNVIQKCPSSILIVDSFAYLLHLAPQGGKDFADSKANPRPSYSNQVRGYDSHLGSFVRSALERIRFSSKKLAFTSGSGSDDDSLESIDSSLCSVCAPTVEQHRACSLLAYNSPGLKISNELVSRTGQNISLTERIHFDENSRRRG